MAHRSPLLPIFLIVLVDVLALTIILPLLPFYAEMYGASPLVVGLLVTTFALCQLVSSPVLGNISDRVGRRLVLLVSQAGTFAGLVLLAFANSLWLVFLARVLDGITAGNLTVAQAYMADVTRPEERTRAFGLIGIAFGIGFVIGPATSGYLSELGFEYPILLAAALSACSIVATYFLLPRQQPRVGRGAEPAQSPRRGVLNWQLYLEYFRRPLLARYLVQFCLFAFAFATFTSGFALFAERRFTWGGEPFGPREVGYVFAFTGAVGIVVQGGLIGRLVARFGDHRLIVAGFMLSALGHAGIGLSYSVMLLVAVAMIGAVGNSILRPTLSSRVTQIVGRHEQGIVLGITQSVTSLAMIAAPPLAGALIKQRWLVAWAVVTAVTMAAGFIIAATTPTLGAPDQSSSP